jgi:hypothetical protein
MSNRYDAKYRREPTNQSLLPLHPLPLLLRAFQTALPAISSRAVSILEVRESGERNTYHTSLELWWLAIKNVCRLDAIFDDSNGAIEKSHQMTGMTRANVRASVGMDKKKK